MGAAATRADTQNAKRRSAVKSLKAHVKKAANNMNRLATDKRIAVVAALVEGTSINATYRMTGVAKHTVLKLLKDLGCAAASYHDLHVRNISMHYNFCRVHKTL
jgi:hypothetical protein